MFKKVVLFFVFAFCLFGVNNAMSAPTFEGKYYDWNVYSLEDKDGNKVCYIATFSKETKGNYNGKRNPYLMITYFKAKEKEEVSVFADFIYKKNSTIRMAIDKNQFKLLTKDKMAWAKSSQDDEKMIEYLMKSEEIKVRSETNKNEYTIDFYSGKGFATAYNKMKLICK